MDSLPERAPTLAAKQKVLEGELKRTDILFRKSVDRSLISVCSCGHCPPKSDFLPGDYCCRFLFTEQLKKFGREMKEGMINRAGGEPMDCFCTTQFFQGHILNPEVP